MLKTKSQDVLTKPYSEVRNPSYSQLRPLSHRNEDSLAEHLLCKREGLTLDPQHPHQMLDTVECA